MGKKDSFSPDPSLKEGLKLPMKHIQEDTYNKKECMKG